jgi:hypothetical protein
MKNVVEPHGELLKDILALLRSELRTRVPAGIKQDEDSFDVVLVSDCKERIDVFSKSRRVVLSEQLVQEHAHQIHADGLGRD